MHLKLFENDCAKDEHNYSEDPKICCRIEVFKKPHLIEKSHPETIYCIVDRIELKQYLEWTRQRLYVPHDRCDPDTYLHQNIDELADISEKYHK